MTGTSRDKKKKKKKKKKEREKIFFNRISRFLRETIDFEIKTAKQSFFLLTCLSYLKIIVIFSPQMNLFFYKLKIEELKRMTKVYIYIYIYIYISLKKIIYMNYDENLIYKIELR